MTRILIADGYPTESVAEIRKRGGQTSAEDLFPEVLGLYAQDLDWSTLSIAEGERLPQGVILADFDGIAITGSPLSAYETDDIRVSRQIEFAQAAFASGVPVWGSCWGMQVMSAALEGSVLLNPNGYEIGIGRSITLTEEGRGHALFNGKGSVFNSVTVHHDEVDRLPDGAELLASNDMSKVQAIAVERDGGSFWGVQYHPEFDLEHVAFLMAGRPGRLIKEGLARSEADVATLTSDFDALSRDPTRKDLAWRYGLAADVLEVDLRTREFGNWVSSKVSPRVIMRNAATL